MATISLCMIVKNESAVLARCLDSIADLMDEIIIVDTGSTDNTKEIAAQYTSRIYDFKWTSDFSAARNFSFSKATMEYIYTADADEILDDANRERFLRLKDALLPEIEIVQMKYVTQGTFDTVLNAKKEYRPKLFRRLRTFTWIDPIHETVRLTPVTFDSDVEILHCPQSLHSKRDFSIFIKAFEHDGQFSPKIRTMYAKELLKTGDKKDFTDAKPIFQLIFDNDPADDARKEAACVLARIYRMEDNKNEFFKLDHEGHAHHTVRRNLLRTGNLFCGTARLRGSGSLVLQCRLRDGKHPGRSHKRGSSAARSRRMLRDAPRRGGSQNSFRHSAYHPV